MADGGGHRDLSAFGKILDKKSGGGRMHFHIRFARLYFGEQGVGFYLFAVLDEPTDQRHGFIVDVVAFEDDRNFRGHRTSSNISVTIRSTLGSTSISSGLAEGICCGWEKSLRCVNVRSISQ